MSLPISLVLSICPLFISQNKTILIIKFVSLSLSHRNYNPDLTRKSSSNHQPSKMDRDLKIRGEDMQESEREFNRSTQVTISHQERDMQKKKKIRGWVCCTNIVFKALGVVMYCFADNFVSEIGMFVFVLMMSCMDFWVVKNVSARILVGLRWGISLDEDGKETWRFICHPLKQFTANPVNKAVFWWSQILIALIWAVLFLINIVFLRPFNFLLLFICCSLSTINLYCPCLCKQQYRAKAKKIIGSVTKLGTG